MGSPLRLFEAFGVEVEYMVVDRQSFDVRPLADRFLVDDAGNPCQDLDWGQVGWSNELVLHVLELKNPAPIPVLSELELAFHSAVTRANQLLEAHGLRLMPTAMHPWMDPVKETQLWPHGDQEIYETYNQIFDCRSHGWANLQSVHLNLPFDGDEEFERLHSAIRLILPLIPALSASSPFIEGAFRGFLDQRMEVYRTNSRLVEGITGLVIPELIRSEGEYREKILQPMYRQIAPYDPCSILQDEWLNARGAIARFDRDAIEIRVIDSQECPAADVAVCQLVVSALRGLTAEVWSSLASQQAFRTETLANLLATVVKDAELAPITDGAYLRAFGLSKAVNAGEIWRHFFQQRELDLSATQQACLAPYFRQGPLARRLLSHSGPSPSRATLSQLAAELCDCLSENRPFLGCDG